MESVPVLPVHKANNETKYHEIAKYFTSCFGSSPQFFARVPGRVNLIGEHIDYCGFSVLPMAIDQDIVLAVGINYDDVLNLINFHGDKYEKFSSSVKDLNINTSSPRWYHYFICGFKGIAEKYDISFKGLDIAVKGIIPPSSGLSSSSALVCASALAASFVNRIFPSKMEIASICAEAERYIGTQGGGMDQAIAFLAEPGTAKLIEFNPLRATSVTLPKGVAFVVSNSCVAMNKAATSQYNMRVMECKL
ncbi:N-acetylgalactosamine kinase, partial [Stegodyphus mimosarum]